MAKMETPSGDDARLRLVAYDETYLQRSAEWLRDPEIQYLTNTPEFSDSDQQAFFRSLPDRSDYRIWGVEVDGRPAGAAGVKNIAGSTGEYWGYLGLKALWGQGLGRALLAAVEGKATALGLDTLTLKVIPDNGRARRLYERSGYSPKGSTGGLVAMEKALS